MYDKTGILFNVFFFPRYSGPCEDIQPLLEKRKCPCWIGRDHAGYKVFQNIALNNFAKEMKKWVLISYQKMSLIFCSKCDKIVNKNVLLKIVTKSIKKI